MSLIQIIQKIRPAPVQVFIVAMLGLNRRREAAFAGCRFFVDPSSDFGSRIVESDYEADMVETLQRYLTPGGAFLDIGANEGLFSVLASRIVGPDGRVVAIEPQNRLIPIIRKNLELNDCENCQIEHCVLGETSGMASINLAAATNTGASSMFVTTRYRLESQPIQCWTLADLLDRAGLQTVDLVKIDVEGAEYDILMPAGEILRSGRLRNIALEYHPSILASRGLSMDDMHSLLVSSGYRLNQTTDNSVYEFVGVA